ncbi:MAG: hypothetical protein EA377_00665 [Phycisphaerales bacterium]|nr:MAG: hypothetical protein EA377_00665 [Phycisphaerales bacterium]
MMSTANDAALEPRPSAFIAQRVVGVVLLLVAAVPYLFVEFYLLPSVTAIMQDFEGPPSQGFQFLIDLGYWRLVPLICFLAFGLLAQLIPSRRVRFMSAFAAVALLLLSMIAVVLIGMQYVAIITDLTEM